MKTWISLLFFMGIVCLGYGQIDKMRAQLDDVAAAEEGLLTLRFYNAVDGEPIPEASIYIQDIGAFTTDMEGKVRFENPGEDGRYPFRFTKEGYITEEDVFEIIANTIFYYRFSMSPKINLGTYRIVLEWDKKPEDLDAHLVKGDAYHISYRHMLSTRDGKTRLDRDDRDGYGPETITIEDVDDHGEYEYYVYDYTNQKRKGSNKLSRSKARVKVYGEGRLLETFQIEPKKDGNTWNVFRIVNGTVYPVDNIRFVN